ncbi:MAG: acyl--CoA ligase [Candidatus Sericytochromatia bacterium]|nr:acyl--CoA ligase [Candidatus Tanganyikabacteria bacterium]
MSVADLLAARSASDAPFLVDALTGHERTFAQVAQRARRWGWYLDERAARRVAVILPNSLDFAELYLGAALAGVTLCPLNPALAPAAAAAATARLGADLLLTTTSRGSDFAGLPTATVGSTGGLPGDLPASGPDFGPVPPDREIALILTSGTTGGLKACRVTHGNVCWTSACTAAAFGFTPGTRYLTPLPLYHINAQVVGLLAALQAGSAVILGPRLPAARLWEAAARTGATAMSAVPAIVFDLLESPGEPPPALEYVVCSSAPLPGSARKRFEARFGIPLRVSYGLTEAGCFVSYGCSGGPPGNVGKPHGCEVRVGDGGELLVRGAGVFAGYLDDPPATAAALRDGWLHTGDLGRLEGGYLVLDGRLKDLINRGGEKVSPDAVEAVLLECPGVREVAVFGVPDPRLGEEVAAAVVGSATDDELWDFCAARLGEFETPRTWHHVEALPRGATGKVLRRVLREEAAQCRKQ